ncbi:MAG: hypothetical protein JXB06_10715 [Spirochaetales bacterium]|nr:hypothetical protein [Spirochaetales bacterium]
MKTLRIAVPLLLLLCAGVLFADVPVREEQFIYSILAFNGKDYAGTFAREDADTIYLVADVDNFITVRNVFVYFWPITQDWKTDTSALNVPFEGTLELGGREAEPETIGMTPYTYYNIRGEYELNWKVAKEAEAEAAWQHYQDLMDAYWKSVSQYYERRAAYEAVLNELTVMITRLRDQGQDVSALIENLRELKAPPEPQYPTEYIVPPVPVQKAFILNLPVGEYDIRFFTEDGKIMEGSERRIVAFRKRRAEAIGLEVIPGDKWTRPVESKTPASVLYIDGSTDLYVRPFYQQEYNDLFYEKMRKNDAKGNPTLMKWVRIQQVPKARVEVTRPSSEAQMVMEEPFYVEQVKGAALGYQIVPFDPEGKHKDREPSLRAFHVPISPDQRVIRMRVQDKDGEYLPSSERQIRIISISRLGLISLILAACPLIVMVIVMARRSRRYTS